MGLFLEKNSLYKRSHAEAGLLFFGMASPPGFEPGAFRLGGERSILLSYGEKQAVLQKTAHYILLAFGGFVNIQRNAV